MVFIIFQLEEFIVFDVQVLQLLGLLACNKIMDVFDDYEGCDKLVYFRNYSVLDSSFIYVVSCYVGEDKIDIIVCDFFIVCDVYYFIFCIQYDMLKLGGSVGQEVFLDDFFYDVIVFFIEFWLDEDVYINCIFVMDQFSFGVVIFDGLDCNGCFYNLEGLNDCFIFIYLDLIQFSGNVYFIFWLQLKGLGQFFEEDDYMVFEFKQ